MTIFIKTIMNSASKAFNPIHGQRKQALVDSTDGLFDELAGSYDAQFSSASFDDGVIVTIIAPTFKQRYEVTYNKSNHLLINTIITEAENSTKSRIEALTESISSIGNSGIVFSTNNKDDIVATIKSPIDLDESMGADHNIENMDSIYSLIKFVIDERYF